jgi:hypothetical protein
VQELRCAAGTPDADRCAEEARMTHEKRTSPDHEEAVLTTSTFNAWWLASARGSLAPTALDVGPAPGPVAQPQPRAQRGKLAFICATGMFWGAALMALLGGKPQPPPVSASTAPPPVTGVVEIGEIQVLGPPRSAGVEPSFAVTPAVAKVDVSARAVTVEQRAPVFNRSAAAQAVNAAAAELGACSDGTQSGKARVAITFEPSGRAISASVDSGALAGTAVGSCVAQHMRNLRVPAFAGSSVTVMKTVHVP